MRSPLLLRHRAALLGLVLLLSPAARASAQDSTPGNDAPTAERQPADTPSSGTERPPPAGEGAEPAPSTDEALVPPVPPPVVPVPELEPPPRPDDVLSGRPVPPSEEQRAREHAWFDASRSFVGRLFFAPVIKLDRFFSDETDLDPERSRSFARLRGGLRFREDGRPVWSSDVLAQLYLPGADQWLNRFRLVLSGATDTTETDLTTDARVGGTPFSRRRDPTNLELRFGAYRGIRSSLDLGAGVLFRWPPGAFTRIRYRLAIPIDELMVLRFSPQVFWRTDLLFGARLSSALEWPVTPSSMIRLAGSSQVAQRRTDGLEYGTALVYSHAFTPTAAVAIGAEALGATKSDVTFDKYRLYTRLRHDVLRRWLFFELEPEVAWPWKDERGGRRRVLAVTFRLEIQFDGESAMEATP